jgi:peptide/nickel transport system substrate-binding protein
MGRYLRWQALIALSGIILAGVFLSSIALSRTTVLVPEEGGIYVEGMAGAPQYVNPLLAHYNQVDQDLTALIFNGLTRLDEQGEVEPDLAEKWTVSPDGLTYLFQLRRDVRWSDGAPFTADDVLFTIGLMQDLDFPGVPYLAELWTTVKADKLDEYTLRFRLQEPLPSFLDYTTIGILPRHVLGGVSAADLPAHVFNLQPIGTGPFMVQQISAERALLVSNPRYASPRGRHVRREKPYLEGLEFRFYPTYERMLTAYEAGEIQGISSVPAYLFPEAAALETLELYTARFSAYEIVYLNLQDPEGSPFFQDRRVRRAMLLALDRQALIDRALYGQGIVAGGPLRPWVWAYDSELPEVKHDPVAATSLLAEAGWIDTDGDGVLDKDGRPFRFTLLTGDDPVFTRLGEAMAEQWGERGIQALVEPQGAGLSDRLRAHDFQAVVVELLLSGDPDPYPLWHQTQIATGQNYGGWDHREASEALERARYLTSREERKPYYVEFQRIFMEEVPALIIAYPTYTYAVDESMRNVQIGPMTAPADRFQTFPDWYMNTRRVIVAEAERPTPGRPTGEPRQ